MDQAKLYSEFNNLQMRDDLYILEKYWHLIKLPKKAMKVMDVGSGDGKFTVKHLVEKIPKFEKLVAVDISESMTNFAKQNHVHENVEFLKFDIASQHIPDGFHNSFDYIFSFMCLHWVENQRAAFKNIFEFLKRGADFFAVFVVHNPLTIAVRDLLESSRWKHYNHDKYWPGFQYGTNPKEELQNLLTQTGFVNVRCHIEEMTYTFPNLESLDGFALSLNHVIVSEISIEDREDYIREYLRIVRTLPSVTIRKEDGEGDETATLAYKYFVAIGTKQ
ncbi:unnamed protein product [Phaedon cochleariae]|uniref:Methyltransferase type 11 domain-containing protein n=1 Tax=Phaedon cochleariae TaxID=80249 RepID=A0A9N9SGQ8_PHACE|nr:unnamed protein product [Phaedon cochleariae]